MTIACSANQERGVTTVVGGDIPDGSAVLTRLVPGETPFLLRGGVFDVTTGGFTRDDTEAPFGVPLTYRLDLKSYDRTIQHNLVQTPTFKHGQQGWLPGVNRTMNIVADPAAHSSSAVGHVTANTAGTAPPPPPQVIGHVESGIAVSGPYTLLPPTTGSGAIATGDWVYIFHQQLSAFPAPAAPSGFTQVWADTAGTLSAAVWRRKRLAGDSGYAVPAVAGATSYGTAMWLRGASDTDELTVGLTVKDAGTVLVGFPVVTTTRPSAVLTWSAGELLTNAPPPAAANVTGSTLYFVQGNGTEPRNTVVATQTATNAGMVPQTRIVYQGTLAVVLAVQVSVPAPVPNAPRVIATAKTALVKAHSTPAMFTGRFRFNTPDLNIWADVLSWGTWQDVKNRGTWADVRGAGTVVGTDYLRLFVAIVNPASGAYYVQPVQVVTITAPQLNKWIDFSFLFDVPVDIPATAEIRVMHGTNVREYACEWWLDEFGITPGEDRAAHNSVYWFDGDQTPPAGSEDRLMPGGGWDTDSDNAAMSWTGTVGNSTSLFIGPSTMFTTTVCALIGPEDTSGGYCCPVFINDPMSPGLAQWFSLLAIDVLGYTARQTLYNVINRASVTAVSQVRSWASGTLTLLTRTRAEREMVLMLFSTGRIVYYRNPDPAYPESSWYLAIGDISEARVLPDGRRPERQWTIPFSRVERPSGLIDSQTGRVWQDVKDDNANWAQVKVGYDDWLEVLTGQSAGSL